MKTLAFKILTVLSFSTLSTVVFAANKYECALKTPLGTRTVQFSNLQNGRAQRKILPGGNGGPEGLGFVELTLLEHNEYPSVKAVFEGQLDGPGFSIGGMGYLFASTPEDRSVDANTISVSYQTETVSLKCTEN